MIYDFVMYLITDPALWLCIATLVFFFAILAIGDNLVKRDEPNRLEKVIIATIESIMSSENDISNKVVYHKEIGA